MGDSLYCNIIFLAVFLLVQRVYALVRMRGNRVFYATPPLQEPGQKGRARKHGRKFKLHASQRLPEQDFCFQLGRQLVYAQVWRGLHFYRLAALIGSVIRLEFLRADGTPRCLKANQSTDLRSTQLKYFNLRGALNTSRWPGDASPGVARQRTNPISPC
ncbi:MAG: hypothetical protein JXA33_19160 [Anaerolineae bacterium]|nr:hypothetical protein [Anaerolineae bacterium]